MLLALSLCLFWAGATVPAALAADKVPVVSAAELEALVAGHKGKPLLLVYWASWCVPCRNYKEKLSALREAYPESELQMLGLSVDTDKDMLQRFMEKNTLPFKTVTVSEEFYESIAGTPVPTTILYGRDGTEQRKLVGNVGEKRLNHYVKKLF